MIIVEQNAILNITVTKDDIPVVINHMRGLRRKDDTDSVILIDELDQKIDEWKAVDVEKVIDRTGNEVLINGDNDLLFATIQNNFFFSPAGFVVALGFDEDDILTNEDDEVLVNEDGNVLLRNSLNQV